MSHRLTKEELDEEFDLFLKESVSDDSDKQPGPKSKPWWQDEQHSGGASGGKEERAKSKFLKAKRSQHENSNAFKRPVPKPRCKALDKALVLDTSSKGAVGPRAPSDGSDRVSSELGERSPDESPPDTSDSHSQGHGHHGLLGKSDRLGDEDPGDEGLIGADPSGEGEQDSMMGPAANTTAIGLDTIEEEEEKARFFAQLEAGASPNLDYSILNRELDSTCSTTAANLRVVEEVVKQSDDERKAGVPGSPQYSEDFEEDDHGEELLEQKSKISPILAKVSLHDSLDDTGGGHGGKDPAGSLDRGPSYVQSGASDMEALHEAYRQIHVVEPSDHQHPSMEGMGRAEHSVQPASTNDSDLPTAEELMRVIRPEKEVISAGGLEDQPHFLERGFPDLTSQESRPKPAAEAGRVAGTQAARGLSSPPDPPSLTWSVRQEVEELLSAQAAKEKNEPAAPGSRASHPSTPPMRNPAAPGRGSRLQGRTAGTSRSSGPGGAAASARTPPSASRPLQHPREKAKSTKSQEKEHHTEAGLKVSGELVASVQSLVSVLRQQIDRSSQQDVPRAAQDREEDGSLVQELRGQLAHKERELQLMKEGAGEINTLRQQNYLLQIKLQSAEEASRKTRWRIEATDLAPEEKLQQIDKEIKEQETLIKGYQQENEKLYLQMKAQQAESKANEEAMCSETQRLLNELASTREQLNKPSRTVGSVCLVDHTQRIADLLAQLNALQRNEAKLSEDFHRVKQEKQAQEVDLQLVKKERDLARAQAVSASVEMRVLEEKHREEVVALRKKLQWFAENQELLDRDAGRLTAATSEIHQLQEQVERLKVDVDKRGSEQQRKTKEKTVDTKRMQDLQQQVKELEQILRRRNPNSLPALMYAAAAAGCQEDVAAKTPPPPSRVTALLERRIQHLEAELEGHDEEAKRGLRAMEQQFNRIKLHYEQQIAELEQKQQLQALRPDQPRTSQAGPVEENHQQRERCLQDQIESLQQQAQSSPGRHQRQAEAASGARIQRLNRDLASKTRTIQDLCRTVERLQKERRNVTSAPNPQAESGPTETKRLVRSAKPLRCSGVGGEETFPAARCEKTYQPTAFTGSHISEVVQENETLKRRVEQLQLQSEQEKKALRADCERAEEELCRLAGHSAEQLSSMRAEHLRVLDQLRASHALEHSSSKVAELTNKLSAQEITVKHLQDRLKEMQGVKEALVISRTREDALQKQLTGLLKELKEAKEAQSPEVKLLCGLERKIVNMELRHQHREKELQQVVVGSWQTSEAESWKRLAQDKSRELEAFRLELDSILDILRHLQRLGVVLPHS
nr:LOW QUALITY PROTEIN: centrosomal protein of 162 kDa [Gasterosteus aculeatus aculeatus]